MLNRCMLGAAVLAVSMATTSLEAAEVDVSLGVDFSSAYVWRGATLNDGLVIQPSMMLTRGGFDAFFWGNIDIDDYDGTLKAGEFSEIDVDLSLGAEILGLETRWGIVQYTFPNDSGASDPEGATTPDGTMEVYAKLKKTLFADFSIAVEAFYDFDEVRDYYAEVIIQHDSVLAQVALLTVGASAGMVGDSMSANEESGLNEYEVFAKAGYVMENGVGIAARLAYTGSLDEDVLPEQDVEVYGAIRLKYLF